jgi:hypothetical protein
VPAGSPDGGQWTTDGGNAVSTSSSDGAGEKTDYSSVLGGRQYAALDTGTLTHATDNGGDQSSSSGTRLAMEPTDPVTGERFSSETPINRLGGGEGGGGGIGERSSSGASEAAAAAEAQGASPRQIGSFLVPENLTYGTTLYGIYAHGQIGDLLGELYPGVPFILRVRWGQTGIDVEVPDKFVGRVGFKFGEIKPLTSSGEATFNRQLQEWGVGPVQAITYDAAGNVYYGFR